MPNSVFFLPQFYACCIFESLESNWSRHNEHRNSLYNFMIRVAVRGGYTIMSTFVACLLPFFGDFISLTGSLCMMPLDLVLVLALFVKVSAPAKWLHGFLHAVHTALACASTRQSTELLSTELNSF